MAIDIVNLNFLNEKFHILNVVSYMFIYSWSCHYTEGIQENIDCNSILYPGNQTENVSITFSSRLAHNNGLNDPGKDHYGNFAPLGENV